ncbi:13147_t:CDS:2 [Ambispora gerdemannii]|uniref:13147_t:CDS:1 n=1 Tax=Ambispora gerdemannii TaxID=144530 RepID=A0A9N9C8Y5_9GLOM|nr:13147_t:CDS:2 [Ambispora gerdemannii]
MLVSHVHRLSETYREFLEKLTTQSLLLATYLTKENDGGLKYVCCEGKYFDTYLKKTDRLSPTMYVAYEYRKDNCVQMYAAFDDLDVALDLVDGKILNLNERIAVDFVNVS